jgi:alpha-1,3-fucosyltransferase
MNIFVITPYTTFLDTPRHSGLTHDRKRDHEADVVVFYVERLKGRAKMPLVKRQGQRWVFFELESPYPTTMDTRQFGAIFNWTMTYRMDSDIPVLLGRAEKKKTPQVQTGNEVFNYAKGKTKLVAWFVSHCRTINKREDYVKELQKLVQVDIYGYCGRHKCGGRNNINGDCFKMLKTKYKFYLSFENAFCKDYLTEKPWNILAESTAVPIVMGAINYTDILPPNSYIDTFNFTSVQQLAYFLKYLVSYGLTNHHWFFNLIMGFGAMIGGGTRGLTSQIHPTTP